MEKSAVKLSKESSLETAKASAVRILHVDDDACFLKTAKAILEMRGAFQVETASSVEEAVGKMKTEKYDVVVCDYQMPRKDGLQFLKELRAKGNSIPFIVFTGKGREEVAVQALNLGADGYYSKVGPPETVYGELAHGIRLAVERKMAELRIWQDEERLRGVFDSSPDAIMVSSLDGNVVDCNDAALKLGDYSSKEEIVGNSAFNFIAEKDRELASEKMKQLFDLGMIRGVEYTAFKKNGETYIAETSGNVLKDSAGEPTGFVIVIEDVTERKKVEEELRIQRKELQVIFDSLPAKTWYKDGNNRLVRVNKAFAEYMGVSKENLEGKPLCDLFPPDIAQKCWEEDKEVIATGQPKIDILDRHESAQGVRWFSTSKVPCSDKNGNIMGTINFSVDITERKRAEEELARSEAKYRSLVDQSLQGMVVAQGVPPRVVFVNPTMIQMSGYTSEELASIPMERLIHPDDRPAFFSRLKDRLEGKPATSPNEYRAIRKDGKVVWIDVFSSCVEYNGQPAVQAMFIDITDRKKTLEKLQILNEKLGVVGGLTRHDVRNKLSAVVGNTYLAEKTLPNDHKALAYLKEIESACGQTTRILDFATVYESLGVEELTLVEVDKAVEEAVSLIPELKGVKVVNNCQRLTVMADSALKQLFFNLIENSLKHGKNVSQIKIHYVQGKDRLKLFFEDNGVGIPKANKPRLFDWGFTTGHGSGYGLPLIKSMMEIYGWTIEEEGEPGKGAKFVLTIPMRADSYQKQRHSNKKAFC